MTAPPPVHGFDSGERDQIQKLGFVVRERVFEGADLDRLRACCEELVRRVAGTDPRSPRIAAGSYVFQANRELCTIVKWEPEHPDVVMGIEPFAHFDPELRAFGCDPRLVGPIRDLLGAAEVELFTEKLNLKRSRVGGPIVPHQDYPYWVENSEDPAAIATAVVFLDDADRRNGCLEVLPGSHAEGPRAGRDVRGFGKFELEPDPALEARLLG